MWKIKLQQKQGKDGNTVDVKVKGVFRPNWKEADPAVDDPDDFPKVCDQMLLEYTDKLGNTTIHKIKHFAGAEKEITNYFGRQQKVQTGGFIYEYQPAVQLDYKGRKVVKEKTIQQKESRMKPEQFEAFLIAKHGKDMAAEIMSCFGE
jgi:hypothetical protein